MKILFIASSSVNGGAQKHIKDMFVELHKKSEEVYLVAPEGWLMDELRAYHEFLFVLQANLQNVGLLKNIMKEIRPDIVNTFILSGACFGLMAWKKVKIGKLLITVNNPVFYHKMGLIKKISFPFVYRWIARYATAFLVKSDNVTEQVVKVIKQKKPVISIKNGVDFTVFNVNGIYDRIRAPLTIDDDDIVVVNVAALEESKGQLKLIDAVSRVKKQVDNLHLILVGSGSLKDKLIARVNELEAESYIHFLGRRNDINCILANSDIFVLSSFHEGLPNALMEAMAMALPCISTDVGGVKQLIDNGINGMVVSPESSDELCNAIVYICSHSNAAKTMGALARQKIYNEYQQNVVVDDLLEIYKSH